MGSSREQYVLFPLPSTSGIFLMPLPPPQLWKLSVKKAELAPVLNPSWRAGGLSFLLMCLGPGQECHLPAQQAFPGQLDSWWDILRLSSSWLTLAGHCIGPQENHSCCWLLKHFRDLGFLPSVKPPWMQQSFSAEMWAALGSAPLLLLQTRPLMPEGNSSAYI